MYYFKKEQALINMGDDERGHQVHLKCFGLMHNYWIFREKYGNAIAADVLDLCMARSWEAIALAVYDHDEWIQFQLAAYAISLSRNGKKIIFYFIFPKEIQYDKGTPSVILTRASIH